MDYQPIARLGRGGMGVVDLARDTEGNRVAIKRLTFHGSASDIVRARQRLRREAEVLTRLDHPNIVRLLDVVEDGDDIVLVMPYLSGGNLAERVAQHGPAPPADVERLGQRLLAALAAAHQAGIIHRDIKPANVLYDGDGEPMLTDFGVAHTRDQTQGLTVAGMVVGTPGYMPPEQARDEPLTPASDVFSLGATLLFAATGIGPYGSGDPGLLMVRAANDQVERLPKHLPKTMRAWLEPMLDPKPERRPTVAAMLTGQGLPPRRRSLATFARTRKGIVAATVAGAVVVLILGLMAANGRSDSSSDDASFGGAGPTTSTDSPAGDREDGDGPDTDLVLTDELAGDFTRPGEEVTIEVPAREGSGLGQSCVEPMVVTLDVTPGIVADLTLVDSDNERLDSGTSELDRPAVLSVEPESCPAPGRPVRAVITVIAQPAASPGYPDDPEEPPEPLGSYVLTREGG